MTQETPKMLRAKLLEKPIQIHIDKPCTEHPECRKSHEIIEGLNKLIADTDRSLAALTISEYLVRIFVQDGFDQSPHPYQSEERLKAGIRTYVEEAFDYVQSTELELVQTSSEGLH